MATRTKQLVTFWSELCRFVLIQLGSANTYGVGFIISQDVAAAHVHESGEDWLVLNPFKRRPRVKSSWEEGEAGEFYSLSDKDDLAWLYAAAVHECTHIADGIVYHDESFSTAFTVNVAKTSGKLKQLTAIRKAVVARQSRSGEVERPAKSTAIRASSTKLREWLVSKINTDGVVILYEGIFEGKSKSEALDKVAHAYGFGSVEDLLAKPWNKDYRWVAEDQS